MIYIPVVLICMLLLLIPIGGTIACFRDKDYKAAAILTIISVASVVVCTGIVYQAKESVAFAEKCEQSNGFVYQSECHQNNVIEIKR